MQVNQPLGKVLVRVIAPILIAVTGFFWLWSSASHVAGQVEDEAWSAPINLSKSGSAAEPQIISDSLNTLHVIWQDTVDSSYVHARTNEAGWSEPVAVEVPFGTRRFFPDLDPDDPTPLFKPNLAAEGDGNIHAVWIDNVLDLYHSSVQADGFEAYENWSGRVKIASQVLVSSLAAGTDGRLHVIYVQSDDLEELPAGLYYRYSDDDGNTWSTPAPLQTSSYFRLLTAETANIQLVADNGVIYVAWDDTQVGRVHLVRSADNGLTWEPVNEIDRREESDVLEAKSPADIRITAKNGLVHAAWQAGHDGLLCSQYHIWSQDGGLSWQPRERILERLLSCPSDVELLETSRTQFLMGTVSERFLAPWYGSRWGNHEDQPTLSSFVDPETLRPVAFSCGQDVLSRGDDLWVVSCGVDVTQDIWLQQRSLTALAEPSADSAWSPSLVVEEGDMPFSEPVFIFDETGRYHAFWVQTIDEADAPFGPRTTGIQYAQLQDGRWSRTALVLSSPEGKTDQPTVVSDGNGRLLAAWSGGNHGEIFFSIANAAGASLPSEWSKPMMVTMEGETAAWPAIGIDAGGTIHLVYAVPSDENRGIYLVTSTDGGTTWSEPVTVFDGAAAGWEVVNKPRLVVNAPSSLHVMWLHSPLPTSVGSDELYYARSTDGGISWSAVQRVQSSELEDADAPILWHGLISSGDRLLHRVWQEWNINRLGIWFQQSLDNGQTWEEPSQIAVLEDLPVPAALTRDTAGQFHLFYSTKTISESTRGGFIVNHRIWRDGGWQEAEGLVPDRRNVTDVRALAATSLDNQLSVILSTSVQDDPIDEVILTERLYFFRRAIELPEVAPTLPPVLTATPAPTALPEATATPEPTPTVAFPTDARPQSGGLRPGQLGGTAGIIFGLGASALLIIGLFTVIGINRARSSRMRR